MNEFVARQPIFDGRGGVFAYELLFRPGRENAFGPGDRDRASARVIEDSLQVFGFDALTAGRRAFVNVTRQVLVDRRYRALPPQRTIIELLETVDADPEVLAACREAKAEGYLVALDDFVFRPALEPLVPIADFIKIDFLETTSEQRREWLRRLGASAVRLLAEKVETREQLEEALAEGFTYFQGYYFQRPEMVSARVLPPFKRHVLRILGELNRDAFDYERIEEIVRRESPIAERLLTDLNGARGLHARITSVRQAHALLGEAAFRRWATLVAVSALGEDRPAELVATCLVRARFCELLAADVGADGPLAFVAGLLSGLDALVGRPMEAVLESVTLPAPLALALRRAPSPTTDLLELALAYERGDWTSVGPRCASAGVPEGRVPALFREAAEWSRVVFG